jgi:hypothetical protein
MTTRVEVLLDKYWFSFTPPFRGLLLAGFGFLVGLVF